MISLVRTTLGFIDRRGKVRLARLMALVLVAALLEMFSVGMVLPFVAMVGDPTVVTTNPWLASVYDWLGRPPVEQFVIITALLLGGLFVGRNAYLGFVNLARQRYVYSLYRSIAGRIARCFLRRPYSHHLDRNSADFTRVVVIDAINVASGSVDPLLIMVTEAVVSGSLVALMIAVRPAETLGAMAVFGLALAVMSRFLRRHLKAMADLLHDGYTGMVKWANQCAGGAREAMVLGRRRFFLDQFDDISRGFARARALYVVVKDLPRLVFEALAVVVLLAMVLVLVARGQSPSEILPFLALVAVAAFRIMPSATRVYSASMTLRLAEPQIAAVQADFEDARRDGIDVWGTEPPDGDFAAPLPFVRNLVLDRVTYRYRGAERAALEDISINIPRGASIGIVGPSGGGKTTLIGILLGLLEPQSGEVRVDGVPLAGNHAAWRARIGYIPQDVFLLDDTIRANVAFGIPAGRVDHQAVLRAVQAAQLDDFIASQPSGLDTVVGERGVKLSGGQRQRIAIARALYHDPDVLLLDEATSALDNQTEREFTHAIDSLAGSRTIIIVAHRLTTVRNCDTLYFLRDGRVAAHGTYDALMEFDDFRRMATVAR